MFQKEGSSTWGGKKDAALRKSDRRKLRDRALDALFAGGRDGPDDGHARARGLVDDALVAPKGGDVLARRLRLASGEHATLFLRTAAAGGGPRATAPRARPDGAARDADAFPTTWPYFRSTQPVLLEYEDATRRVHLIPLLPLLAALPPPPAAPPRERKAAAATAAAATDAAEHDDDGREYRIPNIAVHAEVSKYLCRGADLMRSGIRHFPPPWALRRSHGLVTVSVLGNPQPAAIGLIEQGLLREHCYPRNGRRGGSDELVGPGTKGVGVTIVNCYGDDLWRSGLSSAAALAFGGKDEAPTEEAVGNPLGGGTYDDGNFGNVGFVDGARVHPIQGVSSSEEESSGSDDHSDEGAHKNDSEGTGEATTEMAQLTVTDQCKEPPAETEEEETEPDHDEILTTAFYASLLYLLSSKTPLPMPVSTYYAKHLLAAVPTSGPRLDMKQTTYKKIGPFLKEMAANGVVKLGASKDKKDRCAFLAGVVKNHPDLIQFKREWKKEIAASGGDASLAGVAPAAPQKTKLAVVDLFLVPRHVADGMQLDREAVLASNAKTDERKGTGFLTKTECRALLEQYIEQESLADVNGKGRVLVNGPLCDALYRVSRKNKPSAGPIPEYPTSVKRKDLIERWMDKMEKGHALVQMPGSRILNLGRGGPKPVDIEVEFRQGNRRKFLTRLRGTEEYGLDGAALSRDVATRFACAASVETEPVGRPALRKGRTELTFQGHLAEELAALLTGDARGTSHGGARDGGYGLPPGVLRVALRKGVPARKKG